MANYVKGSLTNQAALYEEKEAGVVPVVMCEVVTDINEIPALTKSEPNTLPQLFQPHAQGLVPVMRLVMPDLPSGGVSGDVDGGTPSGNGVDIIDGGQP